MTVKELVLTSLETFEDESFIIYNGIKEEVLTKELYESVYDHEVESYYLDINKKTSKPYILINLQD